MALVEYFEKYRLSKSELINYGTKFSIVGLAGIFVNQGILALCTLILHWPLQISGLIAIEISILHNFFINNFWTWKDKNDTPFIGRFLRFHLVTIISGSINYLILISLSEAGLHYLLANLIGIGAGTVINFFVNHYWTFNVNQTSK